MRSNVLMRMRKWRSAKRGAPKPPLVTPLWINRTDSTGWANLQVVIGAWDDY